MTARYILLIVGSVEMILRWMNEYVMQYILQVILASWLFRCNWVGITPFYVRDMQWANNMWNLSASLKVLTREKWMCFPFSITLRLLQHSAKFLAMHCRLQERGQVLMGLRRHSELEQHKFEEEENDGFLLSTFETLQAKCLWPESSESLRTSFACFPSATSFCDHKDFQNVHVFPC